MRYFEVRYLYMRYFEVRARRGVERPGVWSTPAPKRGSGEAHAQSTGLMGELLLYNSAV